MCELDLTMLASSAMAAYGINDDDESLGPVPS
jgi:hypothetical protein